MPSSVDEYLTREEKWKPLLRQLRPILLEARLEETIKWRRPCYMDKGRNIVVWQSFNDYCALMFFKGALMNDPKGILVKVSKNVQAERQVRFNASTNISEQAGVIHEYLREAIWVERAGLKFEYAKPEDHEMPRELQDRLDGDEAFRQAFEGLTPGRQRGYVHFISQAKQSKTRHARVEKCVPRILDGLGLNDR